MEMDYVSAARTAGFLMICIIAALIESALYYWVCWRSALEQLWDEEIFGGLKVRKNRDRLVILALLTASVAISVRVAWIVWRANDPPELTSALTALLVLNVLAPFIPAQGYIRYRRGERF